MPEPALLIDHLNVYYGETQAVKDVCMQIDKRKITAFIGPSGCGKSTVLRAINRMNDLVPSANVRGRVIYQGENLYDDSIDPVEVRRRIGMVFKNRTLSPKASTKTSPMARACSACATAKYSVKLSNIACGKRRSGMK